MLRSHDSPLLLAATLAAMGCGTQVEIIPEEQNGCPAIPDALTSLEALEHARCALRALVEGDLPVVEYGGYAKTDPDGAAGVFPQWELVFRQDDAFYVVGMGSGKVAAWEASSYPAACRDAAIQVADSSALVPRALAELQPPDLRPLSFAHTPACATWGFTADAYVYLAEREIQIGGYYWSVNFDEAGARRQRCSS
ncbi:MAG: hypothetical protein KC731_30770, partial [Myxococcales bacterium]|nr:hypothetical protein [Myxococcales bacterium]